MLASLEPSNSVRQRRDRPFCHALCHGLWHFCYLQPLAPLLQNFLRNCSFLLLKVFDLLCGAVASWLLCLSSLPRRRQRWRLTVRYRRLKPKSA